MVSAADILNANILIVDDQESNVILLEELLSEAGCANHYIFSSLFRRGDCVSAYFNTTSSVSMNSLTLIGLVR